MLKKYINKFLSHFGVVLHGLNYVEKLKRESVAKDAYEFITSYFKHKLDDEIVIFDVGANRGSTIHKFKSIFKNARVFAFEPTPQLYNNLITNTESLSHININKLAITDNIGSAIFNINRSLDTNSILESTTIGANSDNSCRNVSKITVETTTIDQYCHQKQIKKVDILNMDIQEMEVNAIKGAKNMLEKSSINLIYAECYFKRQYQDQPLVSTLFEAITLYNYELVDFYNPYYINGSLAWCDAIFVKRKTN